MSYFLPAFDCMSPFDAYIAEAPPVADFFDPDDHRMCFHPNDGVVSAEVLLQPAVATALRHGFEITSDNTCKQRCIVRQLPSDEFVTALETQLLPHTALLTEVFVVAAQLTAPQRVQLFDVFCNRSARRFCGSRWLSEHSTICKRHFAAMIPSGESVPWQSNMWRRMKKFDDLEECWIQPFNDLKYMRERVEATADNGWRPLNARELVDVVLINDTERVLADLGYSDDEPWGKMSDPIPDSVERGSREEALAIFKRYCSLAGHLVLLNPSTEAPLTFSFAARLNAPQYCSACAFVNLPV